MSTQEEYKVKLEVFEGPLDLLLYLIKKDEVDIYNIPIEKITTQYMEYLNLMRMLDLNIAGEFIVMAATLMMIKSRMLLPHRVRLTRDAGRERLARISHRNYEKCALPFDCAHFDSAQCRQGRQVSTQTACAVFAQG